MALPDDHELNDNSRQSSSHDRAQTHAFCRQVYSPTKERAQKEQVQLLFLVSTFSKCSDPLGMERTWEDYITESSLLGTQFLSILNLTTRPFPTWLLSSSPENSYTRFQPHWSPLLSSNMSSFFFPVSMSLYLFFVGFFCVLFFGFFVFGFVFGFLPTKFLSQAWMLFIFKVSYQTACPQKWQADIF